MIWTSLPVFRSPLDRPSAARSFGSARCIPGSTTHNQSAYSHVWPLQVLSAKLHQAFSILFAEVLYCADSEATQCFPTDEEAFRWNGTKGNTKGLPW